MNTISTIDSKSDNAALAQKTLYSVLFSIAFAHLINDLMQSVIPAAYPILKENFSLNFTQIVNYFRIPANGLFIATVIGFYTDKTEALFLSNRYGVHHFWIDFIIDSNSVWMILVQFHLWVLVHRYFIQKRHASLFRFWRKRFGPIHLFSWR
jgi:FSR family fosmidomycin resistance protein-like MFS transporter